jgi:hypothetical protein
VTLPFPDVFFNRRSTARDEQMKPHAPVHSHAQSPGPLGPVSHDRRLAPRQTLVARAVLRSDFDHNTVATGYLSNISMLGVGLHTRRPLAVGEKLQMRLEAGPMKWSARLRVVSCQPHDSGTFDIGAEFISTDHADPTERHPAD